MGYCVHHYPAVPEVSNDAEYSYYVNACPRKALNLAQAFVCADCLKDHCESHIMDLLDYHQDLIREDERGDGPIHVCEDCLARRINLRHF